MDTVVLVVWVAAFVAVAAYLMYRSWQADLERFEEAPDHMKRYYRRSISMFLVEGVALPIVTALFVTGVVGAMIIVVYGIVT